MKYRFAVKEYRVKDNASVYGSSLEGKEMIHVNYDIEYELRRGTLIKPLMLHCRSDYSAIMIEEGEHKGRVAFIEKISIEKVYQ
jgi:hypothetical protein